MCSHITVIWGLGRLTVRLGRHSFPDWKRKELKYSLKPWRDTTSSLLTYTFWKAYLAKYGKCIQLYILENIIAISESAKNVDICWNNLVFIWLLCDLKQKHYFALGCKECVCEPWVYMMISWQYQNLFFHCELNIHATRLSPKETLTCLTGQHYKRLLFDPLHSLFYLHRAIEQWRRNLLRALWAQSTF